MRAGGRLTLAVVAWALSIPVMAVVGSWLQRSVFRSVQAEIAMAHTIEAALVLLAALIYWRCVPRATELGRRVIYLAGFIVLMLGIGYAMLHAAIVLVAVLFGL
jgi:anaerobic C4-dicarboxylate transporter